MSIRMRSAAAFAFAALSFTVAQAAPPENFSAYVPRVQAVKIERSEAPTIDGDLSDAAWSRAQPIEEFYQVEPVEGGEPSQKTVAYVIYDERTLYVAFKLFDTEPERIRSAALERDARLQDEDAIRIFLDPFGTFRDSYFFGTNPNGLRVDALTENNSGFRGEWNTIWEVKTQRQQDGWTAEFAIPFQSFSIDETLKEWNLQFVRTIPRNNEEIRWSNIDRSLDRINLSNPGRLSGIDGVKTGVGLEAQLFATGAASYDWETGETNEEFNPSANIFYKITPGLTGSLTFNTDFADAPLDARQVNTGRFDLFFPETRDFFLQDAQSFEFGGRAYSDNPNGLPFFSRNIGIVEGQPVDIVAGAKISGKLGPLNIGALSTRTGAGGAFEGQFLSTVRASVPVLAESKAGLVFTQGDPTGAHDNYVVGADFQYQNSTRFNGTLYADFAAQTSIDDGSPGAMATFEIAYRANAWNWTARGQHIDTDYTPRLGFANRTGIRTYLGEFFREIRPQASFIREITTGAYATAVTDLDDRRLDSEFGGFFVARADSGDVAEVNVRREYTRIDAPFEIAGELLVPAGEYAYMRTVFEVDTSEARPLSFGAVYGFGGAFDGDFRRIGAGFGWRPNKHFRIGANWNLRRFDLSTGSLAIHVATVGSTIAFTPQMTLRTDIQYDNISEGMTWFSRFVWEPKPHQEVFVSFGHNGLIERDDFPTSFRAQSTSLALRLGHTIRL